MGPIFYMVHNCCFPSLLVSKANVIRMGLERNHREREVRDLVYSVSQPVKQKYT